MDATVWVAIVAAGASLVTGLLTWLGRRADRKDKRGDAIVAGYDRLADDLRQDLAAARGEVRRLQADNDRLRSQLEKRRGGG